MPSKGLFCTSVLLVAVIFKLWLVYGLAITDDSGDPPNYVAQMLRAGPGFFGPGTGLAGWALGCVGIPYRIGLEIGYLAACLLAVRAMLGWATESLPALAAFVVMIFNPTAAELFSHVLSDPVWMIEVVLALALLVLFAKAHSRWRWLLLPPAALALALSVITRTTILPLTAALVAWTVLVLLAEWRKGAELRRLLALCGSVAAVLAVVAVGYKAVCWQNATAYGYYGLSLPDSREYREFYMTLQSVGEPTGDRYYPVDTARLDEIAQAGPASRWFVDAMKTDGNFRRVSQETFGKYDFALGWFHFVVFFNAMPNNDRAQGFAMFQQIEDEIEKASQEGRVKTRFVLPLPDCRLGILAASLPDAAARLAVMIPQAPSRYAWADEDEPRFDDADFSLALHRGTPERDPLREGLGWMICMLYKPLNWLLLPAFVVGLGACLAGAARRRERLLELDPAFAARQLFLIAATVFFAWNVLFCASGVPFFARYVIFQNVLLPLLAAYYGQLAWRLWQRGRDAEEVAI